MKKSVNWFKKFILFCFHRYELVLVVKDQGTPSSFETLRFLTILLVDLNENKPEFPDASNPYKFLILENSPRNIRIGKILKKLYVFLS